MPILYFYHCELICSVFIYPPFLCSKEKKKKKLTYSEKDSQPQISVPLDLVPFTLNITNKHRLAQCRHQFTNFLVYIYSL